MCSLCNLACAHCYVCGPAGQAWRRQRVDAGNDPGTPTRAARQRRAPLIDFLLPRGTWDSPAALTDESAVYADSTDRREQPR